MRRREDASPRPPRRVRARWRPALRLARRQVWRTKGSSALVVALVALPVIALSGGAVFADSHIGSPAQHADLTLGHAQSWFSIAGPADPSRVQPVDDTHQASVDTDSEGNPVNTQGPTPDGIDQAVPAGTRTIELTRYGSVYVNTTTGVGRVEASVGPVWDRVLAGRYRIVSGRAVASDHQAMVSPHLLQRLGAKVGDEVTLTDSGRSFTISGTIRLRDRPVTDDTVYLPAGTTSLIEGGSPEWFVPDWQPDYPTMRRLSHEGYFVYARDLAVDPPAGAPTALGVDQSALWAAMTAGAVAVGFGGYLVVLLAGAAFAVAARRQQRSLAVAASVGAGRTDIFRVVLLQGGVLGTIGGLIGVIVGPALALGLLAITDRDVLGSFWGHWGVNIPWAALVAVVVFAVLIGTLAAIAPARAATHGDVLGALRGARRPVRLKPRRPLWALMIMALGVAGTVGGATGTLALDRSAGITDPTGWFHGLLIAATVLGPLVFQIGIIVAGHFTLTQLARVVSRVSLPARIAARDAAAGPSRVVPAFAAIAACVFIAAFAISLTSMTARHDRENYRWNGQPGSIAVSMGGSDIAAHPQEYADAARSLLSSTDASATALVSRQADVPTDDEGNPLDADAQEWTTATPAEADAGCAVRCRPAYTMSDGPQITAVDPDELSAVLGHVSTADREAFAAGAALDTGGGMLDGQNEVRLVRWSAAALRQYQEAVFSPTPPDASALPTPQKSMRLPVRHPTLAHPQGMMQLLISTQTAERLGIAMVPGTLYATYAQPPTTATVDTLRAAAMNTRVADDGTLQVMVERGPTSTDPILWAIVAAAMVLVFGAGGVCLGLCRFERRPDDATLAAVGAGMGLRRRVAAWQAVTVVGIGTVVGTLAGMISAWGLAEASDGLFSFAAMPWGWLAALALGLPAVMAAASWLVPPRGADLTRRTAIG